MRVATMSKLETIRAAVDTWRKNPSETPLAGAVETLGEIADILDAPDDYALITAAVGKRSETA